MRPAAFARLWVSVCLAACAIAAPASAQTRSGEDGVGIRAYGFVESTTMAAADTFDAIAGTSSLRAVGGAVDVLRIWRGVFARATVARSSVDGERVAYAAGEIFPLGIPLTVKMMPIEIGGGWRAEVGSPAAVVGLYGGAGYVRLRYQETPDFAKFDEGVDESFNGLSIFAGADVTFARVIVIGGEVGYRRVPDAIGAAGLSAVFDETDLGGLSGRAIAGVKF